MKKSLICVFVLITVILYAAATIAAPAISDVEKSLRANFTDLSFSSVTPSKVAGLYEVTEGRNIYYYAFDEGILIAGHMYDKSKQDITALRLQELNTKYEHDLAQKSKDLSLDKAVKTGTGKNTVIEFTDPDCPFCRQAAKFFEQRTDVTKYTFFVPLPMHPDAGKKVRYILSQKDRGKALVEVMKGKLDNTKYEIDKNAEVDDLIKIHNEVAIRMGISSTPIFIVNGTVVSGANIPKIEQLLGKNSAK